MDVLPHAMRVKWVRGAVPLGWHGGFVSHDAEHKMVLGITVRRITFAHWCILKHRKNVHEDQARQCAPTDCSAFALIPLSRLRRHKSPLRFMYEEALGFTSPLEQRQQYLAVISGLNSKT